MDGPTELTSRPADVAALLCVATGRVAGRFWLPAGGASAAAGHGDVFVAMIQPSCQVEQTPADRLRPEPRYHSHGNERERQMSSSQAVSHPSPVSTLGTRARGQLAMLTAQFLLGTGVSLIGLPSETSGEAKAATSILLGVHILIAVGLIVGAALTIRRVPALQPQLRSQAWTGAALITVTVAAGVLTMILKSNWWSFLMAAGFIASYILYGTIYLRTVARKQSHE